MDDRRERVPSHFLVKLRTQKRVHYVFCELSMSYNFDIEDSTAQEGAERPLIDRVCFEDLLARYGRDNASESDGGVVVEEVVMLPEPGDANAPYTRRMQSSSDQSAND